MSKLNFSITCSFCGQTYLPTQEHPCIGKVYTLLNDSIQIRTTSQKLFSNLDNLVFQGGGMKGVCYLGVLQELMKEDPDFFKKIKRFAGTSAGSLVALYMGLGLDPNTDLEDLLARDFSKVLDDSLALRVKLNIFVYRNYAVKDIFMVALDKFEKLETMLLNPQQLSEAQGELKDLIKIMLHYFAEKFGVAAAISLDIFGNRVAKYVIDWVFDLLRPQLDYEIPKIQQPTSLLSTAGTESLSQPELQSQPIVYKSPIKKIFSETFDKALQEVKEERQAQAQAQIQPQKVVIPQEAYKAEMEHFSRAQITKIRDLSNEKPQYIITEETVETYTEVSENPELQTFIPSTQNVMALGSGAMPSNMISDDKTLGATRSSAEPLLSEGNEPVNVINPPLLASKVQDENIEFYKSQLKGRVTDVSPQEDLVKDSNKLYCALGELVWFVIVGQVDANGIKQTIGMFSGEEVKRQMIKEVIERKVTEHGGKVDQDITFRYLAEFKDSNGNNPFKPFYVTSFNSLTLTTDVFSYEHTPDVVVADAVRASISIPIFFTPVTIRENGVPRKAYLIESGEGEEIQYMDGGVLDNYPIWLFDEMKYLWESPNEFKVKEKIIMSNPRTLGFIIEDASMIKIYENPFWDKEKKKLKVANMMKYEHQISTVLSSLINAIYLEVEANHIRQRGDAYRSVFIDNMGMKALSFNLKELEKQRIIEAGKRAVILFKRRVDQPLLNFS